MQLLFNYNIYNRIFNWTFLFSKGKLLFFDENVATYWSLATTIRV